MKYSEQNFVFKQVSYKYLFNVFWVGRERGWCGRLFKAWRLLTFSAFRMSAYSRWVLIRGLALIWINMVLFCWIVIYPVDSIIHLLNNQGHTFLHLVQASKVKCDWSGEQDTPCPSPSSFTHTLITINACPVLSFACLKRNTDITCSVGYAVSNSH